MRHSLNKTDMKAEGVLMLLPETEEEISGSPHELGEPIPLKSRKLGPQCRAKCLSSSPGPPFKSDSFVRLGTVGLTDPLL